jgi:hypothetical protein
MQKLVINKRRLSSRFIAKVQPQARAFLVWDLDQKGLALRIQPMPLHASKQGGSYMHPRQNTRTIGIGTKAEIIHDLNSAASAPLGGRHRIVRKRAPPRVRLERYVWQYVSVPLAEMIYQWSAAARHRRSACASLLPRPVIPKAF